MVQPVNSAGCTGICCCCQWSSHVVLRLRSSSLLFEWLACYWHLQWQQCCCWQSLLLLLLVNQDVHVHIQPHALEVFLLQRAEAC